jgi:hypothetical protein
MGSNIFYFEIEKKCVHGEAVYDGEPLGKLLFFEFPELMDDTKPKRFYFRKRPGSIRYETTKMKVQFGVYDNRQRLQEKIEVPFKEFKMKLRPDIFLFDHNVTEDSTT